jgi:uncharacterized Rmd1/YagE family protein
MQDSAPGQGLLADAMSTVRVRVIHLAERIELKSVGAGPRLASNPLLIEAGERGCAALFRYGVAVLFNLTALEEASFLRLLEPFTAQPTDNPESDELDILVDPDSAEGLGPNQTLVLHGLGVERLQCVADILSKSVILQHYEKRVADAFDRIEPIAASLERHGRSRHRSRVLLRHIGSILLIQHRMVGRVEVTEKPELLWEQPEVERLWLRLEEEYELDERHRALERKLELINRTVETVVDLLHTNRSLRLEWYIVILIVIEVFLMLYELALGR